jgi:hypothetical protein
MRDKSMAARRNFSRLPQLKKGRNDAGKRQFVICGRPLQVWAWTKLPECWHRHC